MEENNCKLYKWYKGLVSKVYKELTQPGSKKKQKKKPQR